LLCDATGVLGLLTEALCRGDNDDVKGGLKGEALLPIFLLLVMLVNNNGWPRGGLSLLLLLLLPL